MWEGLQWPANFPSTAPSWPSTGSPPPSNGFGAIYQRYRDDGLVILGFPCDQLNNQDPGTEAYNKELDTEILISDAVDAQLEPDFQVAATDHGEVVLKGRSAEERCYSI
jgi:hypothetical protein